MEGFLRVAKSHPVSRAGKRRIPYSKNSTLGALNKDFTLSEKYLKKIRSAFFDAGYKKRGFLTRQEWNNSKIRDIFEADKITDSSFEEYFEKIDSNMDGAVSWAEFVQFLMNDLSSRRARKSDIARFIKCTEVSPLDKNNFHREHIISIQPSFCTDEYLTVSNDSIRFWSMKTMHQTRCFLVPGNFQCAIVLEPVAIMAVATLARKLLFFKLENNTLLQAELSGSLSKNALKKLNAEQTGERLKNLVMDDSPLFNIPQCMTQSIVKDRDATFFVGNDEGCVEVFKLVCPRIRFSNNYDIKYLGKKRYHSETISCMQKIPSLNCYGTSSFDGKVIFWSYSEENGLSAPLKVFDQKSMITSFSYINKYKLMIACVSGQDASVWTVVDCKKRGNLKGGINSTILASEFITALGQTFIMTMTNNKEFRLFDAMNYEQIAMWKDVVPGRYFSAGFFDERKKRYLTAFTQVVSWSEDYGLLDETTHHTHNFPIIGTHYSPEFSEIVTVDLKRNVFIFHVESGKKDPIEIERDPYGNDIIGTCLSTSSRLLLVNNNKGSLSFWNYNSGCIFSEINLPLAKDSKIIMELFNINARDYLVRTGWNSTIYIYSSYNDNYELKYQKTGHEYDVSAVCSTPSGLVSGSIGGELIFWLLEVNKIQSKTFINNNSAVEEIIYLNNRVIVTDFDGYISVYKLPKLEFLYTKKAHQELTVSAAISALAMKDGLMITGDSLGYVKVWNISEDDTLIPGELIRCHDSGIISILIICDGKYFVTTGNDQNVRLWSVETNEFIGTFDHNDSWDINDEETWGKVSPIEIDKIHMEKPEKDSLLVPGFRASSNPSIPIPKSNSLQFSILKKDDEERSEEEKIVKEEEDSNDFYKFEPKAFSVDNFTKTFEEYTLHDHSIDAFMEIKNDTEENEFNIKNAKKSLFPVSSPEEIKARIFTNKNPSRVSKASKLECVRRAIIKPNLTPPPNFKKPF